MKSTDKKVIDNSQPGLMEPASATTPNVEIKKVVSERLSGKVSKESVNYRHVPKGSSSTALCGNCTMFQQPASCSLVAGSINPHDTCDRFEEK